MRLEGMANDYSNLGIVFQTRGQLNEAETMYKKALEINEKLGRLEGMANNYSNLGIVLETKGELDEAETMYKKALKIAKKAPFKHIIGIVTTNLQSLTDRKK